MGNHVLFIHNVVAHFVVLMSGIVSFVIAIISAIRKKPIGTKPWFWVAGAICLIIAFDMAWQDEHRNTQTVIAEKAIATGAANSCRQEEQINDTYTKGLVTLNSDQRGTIDTQQQLINSQQKDVSSCVVSLGKMNPTVRREIKVIFYPIQKNDERKIYGFLAIIATNQDEPKAAGDLVCDRDISLSSTPDIVTPSNGLAGTRADLDATIVSNRKMWLDFQSIPSHWGPTTPIILEIRTATGLFPKCTFTPR